MLFWPFLKSGIFRAPLGTLLTTDSNYMAKNTLEKGKLPGEIWGDWNSLNQYVKISMINSEFWAPQVIFIIFY